MAKVDDNCVVISKDFTKKPGSHVYIETEYYVDDDGVKFIVSLREGHEETQVEKEKTNG